MPSASASPAPGASPATQAATGTRDPSEPTDEQVVASSAIFPPSTPAAASAPASAPAQASAPASTSSLAPLPTSTSLSPASPPSLPPWQQPNARQSPATAEAGARESQGAPSVGRTPPPSHGIPSVVRTPPSSHGVPSVGRTPPFPQQPSTGSPAQRHLPGAGRFQQQLNQQTHQHQAQQHHTQQHQTQQQQTQQQHHQQQLHVRGQGDKSQGAGAGAGAGAGVGAGVGVGEGGGEEASVAALMEAKTMKEILHSIDPSAELTGEVEEALLDIADDFIHSVTAFSCQLARHRKSPILEPQDVMLHLERSWNMRIPGYPPDEYRVFKRPPVSDLHKQRLASVRRTTAMAHTDVTHALNAPTAGAAAAAAAGGGQAAGNLTPGLPHASKHGGGLTSPRT